MNALKVEVPEGNHTNMNLNFEGASHVEGGMDGSEEEQSGEKETPLGSGNKTHTFTALKAARIPPS
jgi:hypothetical protein